MDLFRNAIVKAYCRTIQNIVCTTVYRDVFCIITGRVRNSMGCKRYCTLASYLCNYKDNLHIIIIPNHICNLILTKPTCILKIFQLFFNVSISYWLLFPHNGVLRTGAVLPLLNCSKCVRTRRTHARDAPGL